VLYAFFAPRTFNKDPSHRLGSRAKVMCTILPIWLLIASKAQPSLVHESRWLESMPFCLLSHFAPGDAAEILVNKI
jgi:hypothetical protein